MPDEPVGGAPAGGSGGADAGGSGGGGASSAPAAPSAPAASVSDIDYLNQPDTPSTPVDASAEAKPGEPKPGESAAPEEINLSALEPGQPEWLAKVTDPAVKTEVDKLLAINKAFSDKFKDAADLEDFFKDLPGGREQVTALQTLSKEVGELDSALEANDPAGLAPVVERYRSMTPDGGVNLMRAFAEDMAKGSPEAWKQIASELVNSTLKASGIGADLQGLVSAIADLRTAAEKQDWDGFGVAAGKIMGQPKAEAQVDPKMAKLAERESAAKAGEQKALTENFNFRRDASVNKINTHYRTEAGKLLSQALPKSIGEADRGKLLDEIGAEIWSQVNADAWTSSKITALIGPPAKSLLTADQKAFDEAAGLKMKAANPKLITAAVAKVVSKWSTERAAGNLEARNKARGAAARTDVGGGKPAGSTGRKPITVEGMRARNADGSFKISDQDFLNS